MFNAFHDQTFGEHEETKCVFYVLYQLHYVFLVVCTLSQHGLSTLGKILNWNQIILWMNQKRLQQITIVSRC